MLFRLYACLDVCGKKFTTVVIEKHVTQNAHGAHNRPGSLLVREETEPATASRMFVLHLNHDTNIIQNSGTKVEFSAIKIGTRVQFNNPAPTLPSDPIQIDTREIIRLN